MAHFPVIRGLVFKNTAKVPRITRVEPAKVPREFRGIFPETNYSFRHKPRKRKALYFSEKLTEGTGKQR